MGILDKLLGRGKEMAEKSMEIAGEALDKGKDLASEGLERAGGAMQKAGERLGGDEPAGDEGAAAQPSGETADTSER